MHAGNKLPMKDKDTNDRQKYDDRMLEEWHDFVLDLDIKTAAETMFAGIVKAVYDLHEPGADVHEVEIRLHSET